MIDCHLFPLHEGSSCIHQRISTSVLPFCHRLWNRGNDGGDVGIFGRNLAGKVARDCPGSPCHLLPGRSVDVGPCRGHLGGLEACLCFWSSPLHPILDHAGHIWRSAEAQNPSFPALKWKIMDFRKPDFWKLVDRILGLLVLDLHIDS